MSATLTASGLGAAALCPGKCALEAGLTDTDTAASLKGTSLHPYFRTSLPREHLSPEDQQILADADRLSEKFIAQFCELAGIPGGTAYTEEHEVEMRGLVPGHPDSLICWYGGDFVVINDLKSGMGDVDDAPDNYQMRAYSLLQRDRRPFKLCGVAIQQPNALGPRMTTAFYDAAMMPLVEQEIRAIVDGTNAPGAPRNPGKACQFCKAPAICPEFNAPLRQLVVRAQFAVQTLTNEDLELYHAAGQCWNKIKDEVNEELRTRIRLGGMPGWTLKNNGSTKTFTDLLAFYNRLTMDFSEDPDLAIKFMKCLTPSWEKLTALGMELTKLPKQKARERLEEIASGLIAEEPKEKSPRKL